MRIHHFIWLMSCGHKRGWPVTDPEHLRLLPGDLVKCYECPAHVLLGSGGRIAADVHLERRL